MPKRIPMRQCLGCREMKPKPELLRVVRSPEGEVSLDARGKKPGRGAYALDRALETKIPDEVMERLTEALERGDD